MQLSLYEYKYWQLSVDKRDVTSSVLEAINWSNVSWDQLCVNTYCDKCRHDEVLFTSVKTYNYLHSIAALIIYLQYQQNLHIFYSISSCKKETLEWIQKSIKNTDAVYWHTYPYNVYHRVFIKNSFSCHRTIKYTRFFT